MNKARNGVSHLTMSLSLMFIVFLILDQFNPMMNFIDNNISRGLLALLCACGMIQSVLHWMGDRKPETVKEGGDQNEG